MSEYIEVGQPLQFTDPNTPTRVGEIVENVSDIYNIPSPHLGMQVFVKSEKKSFVITSLKSKVVNGVDVPEAAVEAFEAVGAKSITWNNDTDPSNMNDFVVAGVYDIKGEHTREDDNLPILNTGGGHSFNARLTVLDSSISGSGNSDDKCITQVLSFSNRLGQGEVYIRTGKGSSLYNLTWENWSTLQRNVNVGEVGSLDDLKDNGIYSGVWKQGRINPNYLAFVCIVINDYFIGIAPRRVSQFVYGLSKSDGSVVYQSRVWDDSKGMWGNWEILNQKEIASMISAEIKKVTDGVDPNKIDSLKDIITWIEEHGDVAGILAAIEGLYDELGREIDARMSVDNDTRGKGVLFGNFSNRQTTADEVVIGYKNIAQDAEGAFSIPAATTEKAGVMSAEDKKSLDTATSRALRALFVAAGAEYNDTNTNKTKTTPWGETVQHLPKHYYLNGLGDITEEQMTEIYNAGRVMQGVVGRYNKNDKIRTNLPSLHSTSAGYSRDIDGRGMFYGCAELEVAIISKNFAMYDKITINSTGAQFVFYNCPKVRYISRLSLESGTSTTNIFGLCSSLSHVEIKSLSTNLSFSNSPLIDKESILYLIQNNKAKSAITVTLHADAYNRLANDADIVAALEAQPLVTLVSA